MKKGSFLKRSAVVAFGVLLMAGCGGSGVSDDTSGGGTDGGTDGGTGGGVTGTATCVLGAASSSGVLQSIQYDSASNASIAISNIGNSALPTSSILTFSVCGTDGGYMASVPVTFTIDTSGGNAADVVLTAIEVQSNAAGIARVTLSSGDVAKPAVIRATAVSNAITKAVVSSPVSISTGYAHSLAFEFGAETFNVDGYDISPAEAITTVTVRASDHSGNPVPDGTTVSFKSFGGQVEPSCITANGACSANWFAKAPRAGLYTEDVAGTSQIMNGRARVLAVISGEDSFTDNSTPVNGRFDAGDTMTSDIGEAFWDKNENNVFDTGIDELIVDTNSNGARDGVNGVFDGPSCNPTGGSTCSENSISLYSNITIVMSSRSYVATIIPDTASLFADFTTAFNTSVNNSSQAARVVAINAFYATNITALNPALAQSTNYRLVIWDVNGNPLAEGSTIVLTADGLDVFGQENLTVQNTTVAPHVLNFSVADPTGETDGGELTITITPTNGTVDTTTYIIP